MNTINKIIILILCTVSTLVHPGSKNTQAIMTLQDNISNEIKKQIFDHLEVNNQLNFRLVSKECNAVFNIMFDNFDLQGKNNPIADVWFAKYYIEKNLTPPIPHAFQNRYFQISTQEEPIRKKFKEISRQNKKKGTAHELLEKTYSDFFTLKQHKNISAPSLKKDEFPKTIAPFLQKLVKKRKIHLYQQFFCFLCNTSPKTPNIEYKDIQGVLELVVKNKEKTASLYILPILCWLEKKQNWRTITQIGILAHQKNYKTIIAHILASLHQIKRLSASGEFVWQTREKGTFYLPLIQYCLSKKKYSSLQKIVQSTTHFSIRDIELLCNTHRAIIDAIKILKKQYKSERRPLKMQGIHKSTVKTKKSLKKQYKSERKRVKKIARQIKDKIWVPCWL